MEFFRQLNICRVLVIELVTLDILEWVIKLLTIMAWVKGLSMERTDTWVTTNSLNHRLQFKGSKVDVSSFHLRQGVRLATSRIRWRLWPKWKSMRVELCINSLVWPLTLFVRRIFFYRSIRIWHDGILQSSIKLERIGGKMVALSEYCSWGINQAVFTLVRKTRSSKKSRNREDG